MWHAADYQWNDTSTEEELPEAVVERAFALTWRTDFSAPGFCVLEVEPQVGSCGLRALLLDLKERLSDVGVRRAGVRFAYRSLGRFDQQMTTRFHLDGAPDRSLLMLGYEPSRVASRLALADYTRYAHDLGIDPRRFLDEYNPMYRPGADRLIPYVTELPPGAEGWSRIVLINNSALPFAPEQANPLGVLHQAEIPAPDPTQRRVVNSIMLQVGDSEEIDASTLENFVTTDAISGQFFGSD